MRNYVIINGVNSLDIQGLAINNLPPITKPMIRTQREEIDGRDGDIVTELGYSAYDKSMEIGLYGNFDIDEIIKYFTGEGTITFSNEDDKYYYFKILDQIDYEKLLKFKTAVVTFHCQPFKYPLEETPIEGEAITVTGSGSNITLENTVVAPMDMKLKGNTIQDGTPTPDSPIPVQVVSGDNSIVVSNSDNTESTSYPISLGVENLLNSNINKTTINGITFTPIYNDDSTLKYIIANGTASANVYFTLGNVNVKANTSYLLSGCPANDGSNAYRLYAYMYDSNNTYINVALDYGNGTTFSNATLDHIQVGIAITNGKVINNLKFYPMVELGTTKHPYNPYGKTPIELCKIGTYQDKIFKNTPNTTDYDSNLEDNVWYLKKEIGKVVLDGSETKWYTFGGANYEYQAIINDGYSGSDFKPSISNRYVNNNVTGANLQNYQYSCFIQSGEMYVRFRHNDITTLEDYKTWLGTHNTEVIYPLATPTYETITDTTLIGQLEALKPYSYNPVTNITQTNNDAPFDLDVSLSYTNTMNVNNVGNIYAKPILTIEGSGTIGIILNDIEVLSVDLGTDEKITIDVPNLQAYNPDNDVLLNRNVTGDYMKLLIKDGDNTIAFSGSVTSATLTNYTRYI